MRSYYKIILSLSVSIILLIFINGSMLLHLQKKMIETHSSSEGTIVFAGKNSQTGIRSMVVSEPQQVFDRKDQFLEEHLGQENKVSHAFSDTQKSLIKPADMLPEDDGFKKAIQTELKPLDKNANQPVLVIYDDELVIEFPKKLASVQNIKLAVARVLLSPAPQNEQDLLSKKTLLSKQNPYFYRKALDHKKQPIRYPKQAYLYTSYLLEKMTEEYSDVEGNFIAIHIPLEEIGLKGPAKNYQNWVEGYANEFSIDPSLIYAIMETESAFNPKAVSRSNAIGLMQVKPHTAGRDVYEYVDEKKGQPSRWDLFDSEKNIRLGTAYLSLLKHDYLSRVENVKIKQMLTISSYNGGLSTVLSLFGNNSKSAINNINRMTPQQVYRKLKYEHHSDETRRYIDKVMRAESKYKKMLNEV